MSKNEPKAFDFNRDMDDYLTVRRKGEDKSEGYLSNFKKYLQREPQGEQSNVQTYGEQSPGIISRIASYLRSDTKITPQQEHQIEEEVSEEFTHEMEDLDRREEELMQEEEELKQKRTSVVWEFLQGLNFLRRKEEEEYDDVVEEGEITGELEPEYNAEVRDDLKEIGKITVNVMKQLPKIKVSAFKNSAEFAKFKEIMHKYDLIK